jgi:hypothetical protein
LGKIRDQLMSCLGIILTAFGVVFAGVAAAYSIMLFCKYVKDRHEDFEQGNRILKIELKMLNKKIFYVTIKNENNIKRIGIYKAAIENKDGHIVELYTIDDLNERPKRYIEAAGIEIFGLIPRDSGSWGYINAIPCTFSIIDTNSKKDEIVLNSMNLGILYEAEP